MSGPTTDGVAETPLITRRTLGVAMALATLAFGGLIVFGALEHSIGWDDRGPEPGYFPFRIGLTIIAASLVTLWQALRAVDGGQSAITQEQAKRVTAFVLPMLGFVLIATSLGMYVATIVYLVGVMWGQGGYRLLPSFAVGFGTAISLYLMFDKWLKVPLGKGPIEAMLGIH
jgi:hypothetical protein